MYEPEEFVGIQEKTTEDVFVVGRMLNDTSNLENLSFYVVFVITPLVVGALICWSLCFGCSCFGMGACIANATSKIVWGLRSVFRMIMSYCCCHNKQYAYTRLSQTSAASAPAPASAASAPAAAAAPAAAPNSAPNSAPGPGLATSAAATLKGTPTAQCANASRGRPISIDIPKLFLPVNYHIKNSKLQQ
jgi:hypothetical protein